MNDCNFLYAIDHHYASSMWPIGISCCTIYCLPFYHTIKIIELFAFNVFLSLLLAITLFSDLSGYNDSMMMIYYTINISTVFMCIKSVFSYLSYFTLYMCIRMCPFNLSFRLLNLKFKDSMVFKDIVRILFQPQFVVYPP